MIKTIPCDVDGYTIQWYDSLTSTNDKATELALLSVNEGAAVITDDQTKGRGQRQNSWESEKGQNMTFSLIIYPQFLLAEQQFLISKITSLAVCNYLGSMDIDARIKWPNDIYIDDHKVTGILIENSIIGEHISFSILGIGINLNQESFNKDILNPISVFQKTGKKTDIFKGLNHLLYHFNKWYNMLKNNEQATINNSYLQHLYRKEGFHLYKSNERTFKAKIAGILNNGELVLEEENGNISHYAFKEISYVLPLLAH
ncbi:MAG: biotin--[acetyl-CoA-carboxylase] ligase [Prevotellaceae bacterium]|jgi:BirA family biotin operon repressor/biotin-[acetyl-CoA-carboxylase] ligase|nr:biotin--[acetyl-CoA-carboxylase] ligase [Prevotellaceae bacterium]